MTTPTPQPKTVHHLFTFYLSPAHIDKPATVTIDSADIREVFNDKAGKELPALVIHFRDARRSLKCNKTQAESIWQITGTDDHTKWAGTRVTLTKVPTKRGGKFTIKITKPEE
jgi:hypothetical protein